MGGRRLWGVTPRQSVEAACHDHGIGTVVAACVTLLHGGEADPALIAALAGPRAPRFLDAPPEQRYWLRVWGARGLMWAPWDASATAAILVALGDEHWRVREMAAKVTARHRLTVAQESLAALLTDENERVRAAAARALRLLTG